MFTHFVQSRRNLSHSRQAFWAFGFHEISQKKRPCLCATITPQDNS